MEKLNTRALLAALCLALGVAVGWLIRTNRRTESQLADATRELRSVTVRANTVAPVDADSREAGAASTVAATSAHDARPSQPSPAARLAADPAWRAARLNEAVLQVEARYGRFFQKLGWPAERVEALKRQLALNDFDLMLTAISGPTGTADPAQAKAMRDEMERHSARNQAALREQLGEADFAKLEQYQRAEPYREAVGQIANAMRSQGAAISGELEESILNGYASALQAAAQQAAGINADGLTGAERTELRQQQRQALQRELVRSLSGVLNPQQLDLFLQSYLEQQGG